MNRKIILFLFLFLIIPFTCANGCIDSDNGQNYFVKGTTSGVNDATLGGETIAKDYCQGNLLYEYFCMDLSEAKTTYDLAVAKIIYECPKGCDNGVCLKESNEEPSTIKKSSGGGSSSSSSSNDEKELLIDEKTIILNSESKDSTEIISLGEKKDNEINKDSKNSLIFLLSGFLLLILFSLVVVLIYKKKKHN